MNKRVTALRIDGVPLTVFSAIPGAEKSDAHLERLKEKEAKKETEEKDMKTVVFISTFEHHSNILPWRETKAVIEIIPINEKTGDIDYDFLVQKLQEHSKAKVRSFSGCSNITGVYTNTDILSYLMHLHDGIAIFDMTACAPYLKMDVLLLLPLNMQRRYIQS